MSNKDESYKDMFLQVRQAILMVVDAIERHYGMMLTSDLRKDKKAIVIKKRKKKAPDIQDKIEASYHQQQVARPDDPDRER